MGSRLLSSLASKTRLTNVSLRFTPVTIRSQEHFTRVRKEKSNSNLARGATLAALLAAGMAVPAGADTHQSFARSILDEELTSVLQKAEPQTGIDFPVLLPSGESLHGTGVRLMGGLVRVYAIGLYIDAKAAQVALKDWKGFGMSDILNSESLWERICDPEVPIKRTLRMVVVREVGGEHMRDGFKRGLAPRINAVTKKGNCKPAECKKAMREFADLFVNVGKMKVGSDIRVEIDGGVVSLSIDDRWLGEVKNPQLAWALVDMFLGEKAVAPTLRQSTAEALEELLRE